MPAFFGVAGNPDDFYEKGYKSSDKMPVYLHDNGLDAYEYQCGRGVSVGADKARQIGLVARDCNIVMSLHSPYFISLSSPEKIRQDENIRYMLESCRAAAEMGAKRVVIHCGGAGKDRTASLEKQAENFAQIMRECGGAGFENIIICPETMGKINQLGSLDEIIGLAAAYEEVIPCVDFGHLNARTQGSLKTEDDFAAVFDALENGIGKERTASLHIHFSRIQYRAGGEYKHLTFEDCEFGPFFPPCAKIIAARGYNPAIISESAGTQTADALSMKKDYREACEA